MIKKISALVLALVICLSVVVMPASAVGVELGSYDAAFALEWDKDSYSAGETAYLSLYIDVKDGIAINQINTSIALNTEVLDVDTSVVPTAVFNETIESYFKTASAMSWFNSTQLTRVQSSSTDAEKLLYDNGFKWAAGKNAQGDHENAQSTKDGFYFDSYDSNEPVAVFEFKVKEGIADGTAINALIVSGSATGTAATAPVMLKYYKNPGNAVTTGTLAAASFDFSQAVATATVGTAAPASIINPLKGQMRYANTEKTVFDVRALAYISGADFNATFTDIPTAKSMITEAGFVFAAGSNVGKTIDTAIVKDIIENYEDGTGRDGFLKKQVHTISTSIQPGDYVLSCMVPDVTEVADYNNSLIAVAYIVYKDANGDSQCIYYDDAQVIEFKPLFDAKV